MYLLPSVRFNTPLYYRLLVGAGAECGSFLSFRNTFSLFARLLLAGATGAVRRTPALLLRTRLDCFIMISSFVKSSLDTRSVGMGAAA